MSSAELLPDHIIEAICNDPRHARGKVARIATFGRVTLPNGEVRWLVRGDDGNWRYTRADPDGVYRRYGADADKGSTYLWPCKLCSRSLEVREDTLHQVLESVYCGLRKVDARGAVSQVPIAVLRHVASKLTRLQ
jgi:hypothetical protein